MEDERRFGGGLEKDWRRIGDGLKRIGWLEEDRRIDCWRRIGERLDEGWKTGGGRIGGLKEERRRIAGGLGEDRTRSIGGLEDDDWRRVGGLEKDRKNTGRLDEEEDW